MCSDEVDGSQNRGQNEMGDLYRSGEEKSNEGLVDQHHRSEKMKERIGSRRERVNFSGSSMTGKKREREKAG